MLTRSLKIFARSLQNYARSLHFFTRGLEILARGLEILESDDFSSCVVRMALPSHVGEGSGVGSVFYIIRPPKCSTRFRSVLAHHLLFIGAQAARPELHPSGNRRDGQDGRFQILRQWCHSPVPADIWWCLSRKNALNTLDFVNSCHFFCTFAPIFQQ